MIAPIPPVAVILACCATPSPKFLVLKADVYKRQVPAVAVGQWQRIAPALFDDRIYRFPDSI